LLVNQRKNACKKIYRKDALDPKVILFRYRLTSHQISRKKQEQGNAYHAVTAYDGKHEHRLSVNGNVVVAGIKEKVYRYHQKNRQTAYDVKRKISVLFVDRTHFLPSLFDVN